MAGDATWVDWAKEKGFNMLACGTDQGLFAAAVRSMVGLMKDDGSAV